MKGCFKKLPDMIPRFLENVNEHSLLVCKNVFEFWTEIIDPKIGAVSKLICFEKGILTVQVKTSLALSILTQDKKKILQKYKVKFPNENIRDIIFRIG